MEQPGLCLLEQNRDPALEPGVAGGTGHLKCLLLLTVHHITEAEGPADCRDVLRVLPAYSSLDKLRFAFAELRSSRSKGESASNEYQRYSGLPRTCLCKVFDRGAWVGCGSTQFPTGQCTCTMERRYHYCSAEEKAMILSPFLCSGCDRCDTSPT